MATNERGSDERRSGGGTPPGQGIMGSATPCRFFGTARGCFKGASCRFRHAAAGAPVVRGGRASCGRREGTLRLFNPAKVRRGFIQDRIFALVVCCRLSLCGPDPLAASKKSSTRTLKPGVLFGGWWAGAPQGFGFIGQGDGRPDIFFHRSAAQDGVGDLALG